EGVCGKAHATLGEIGRAERAKPKYRLVAGVADPMRLLVERAVRVGVFHAQFERERGDIPDLSETWVAGFEMSNCIDRVRGLDQPERFDRRRLRLVAQDDEQEALRAA